MKRFFCVVAIWVALGSIGLAQQDPGLPDTLIIGSVDIDSGSTFCIVPVYFTCDETLSYYNIPIKWITPDQESRIYAADYTQYLYPITNWDYVWDTVVTSQDYKLHLGFADLGGAANPMIYTNEERLHVWSVYFVIPPGTVPQIARLDTTWHWQTGSAAFGDYTGVWNITPVVIPGYINLGQNSISANNLAPQAISLTQNRPNPFNSSTLIAFTLEKEQFVSLTVYDLLGRKVRSLIANNLAAGEYNTIWDGRDNSGVEVVSGIYYYRLSALDRSITNKMLLLR